MNLQSLYKDWVLLFSKINDSDIQLYLQVNQSSNYCPSCQTISSRIHSRYWRTVKDMSVLSLSVHLYVRSRKFFVITRAVISEFLQKGKKNGGFHMLDAPIGLALFLNNLVLH